MAVVFHNVLFTSLEQLGCLGAESPPSCSAGASASCGSPPEQDVPCEAAGGAVAGIGQQLLFANPLLRFQATEIVLLAVFWKVVFSMVEHLFRHVANDKPWLDKAAERQRHTCKKTYNVDFPLRAARENYIRNWPIFLQHVVSGALCLPVLAGNWPPELLSTLARHAGMSEVAYELADVCETLVMRFVSPGGQEGLLLRPNAYIALMACHHLMGTLMVVPMNSFYSHVRGYAHMILLLQFAAGIALFSYNYTLTLDAKKPGELLQMRVLSVVAWVVTASCRGPAFVLVASGLVRTFAADQAWGFLTASVPAVLGMCVLNCLFIFDSWQKMCKFLRWAPEPEGPQPQQPEQCEAEGQRRPPRASAARESAAEPVQECPPTRPRRMSAASAWAVDLAGASTPLALLASRARAAGGTGGGGDAKAPALGRSQGSTTDASQEASDLSEESAGEAEPSDLSQRAAAF